MENLFMNFFRTDMILTFLSSSNKGWKVLFSFFFWIKKFGFKYKYFKSDSQLLHRRPPCALCSIDFNWIREHNAFECRGNGKGGGKIEIQRNQSRRISFHSRGQFYANLSRGISNFHATAPNYRPRLHQCKTSRIKSRGNFSSRIETNY